MSLAINWQQGMAAHSPFTNGLGSTNNLGKLNVVSNISVEDAATKVDKADSISTTANISMEDFLSTIRENLIRLDMQDNEGETKDVEPLVKAFESTINQLEREFGKGVADMAMSTIAQGIENGGASDVNMTKVLSDAFSKIALDPTLKGKNIELTRQLAGKTLSENDNCSSDGLMRMLNSGINFYLDGQGGLAKALGDFYLTSKDGIISSKRFSLSWNANNQAYGIKLITDEQRVGPKTFLDASNDPFNTSYMYYPPEAYDNENFLALKPEWYAARMQADFMAEINPDLDPIEKRKFIGETTYAIVNGGIEYNPTEKMREAVDLFVQYKEYMNTYWADYNKYWESGKVEYGKFKEGIVGVEYEDVFQAHLNEKEKNAYKEMMDGHNKILKEYDKKFTALRAQALEEFKKTN